MTSVEDFTLLVEEDVSDIQDWSGVSPEQAIKLRLLLRQLVSYMSRVHASFCGL